MKKIIFAFAVLATSFASAQVGVGNTDPKATLDVNKASYATGEQAGIAVTQQTAAQIEAMTTTDLKAGTLVYATTATGTTVNAVGYWNWSGTVWVKAGGGKFVDGTIPANAVFTGGNVGIGTIVPSEILDIRKNNLPIALKVDNGIGMFRAGVSSNSGHYGAPVGGDVVLQNNRNFGLGFATNGDNLRLYITNDGMVGINAGIPDESAQLEVKSTNKGFLPPRMTALQMASITNPSEGLIVYCTDCKALRVFDGIKFVDMVGNTLPPAVFTFTGENYHQGDFYANKIMDASNLGILQINVTTPGTIQFTSTTVNGYSFTKIQEFPTIGLHLVILNASGTQLNYNPNGDLFTITGIGSSGSQSQNLLIANAQLGVSFSAFSNGTENFSQNLLCASKAISTSTSCPASITVGSNTYSVANINGQCWMRNNLKEVSTNPCGSAINTGCNVWLATNETDKGFWGYFNLSVSSGSAGWATTEFNSSNGLLYQWSAGMNGSTVERFKGVCPVGWHIPSDCEWMYLEHGLGMSIQTQELETGFRTTTGEGTKLKSTSSNDFSGFLAGSRQVNAAFVNHGVFGHYMSSTSSGNNAYMRTLSGSSDGVLRGPRNKTNAYSVRCLKDN